MISHNVWLGHRSRKVTDPSNSETLELLLGQDHLSVRIIKSLQCKLLIHWCDGAGDARQQNDVMSQSAPFKMETFLRPCGGKKKKNIIQQNPQCLSFLSAQSELTAASHVQSQ